MSGGAPSRILFLDHFNRHGGAQEYVLDLASALQAAGREVFVTDGPLPSLRARRAGIRGTGFSLLGRSYRSPSFYGRMLANIVQLRAFVRREGIGILHCNSVPVLALARLVAGRRRIVFTCHDFLSHPAKLFLVARCPDSIVSVSAAIRDDLVRKGIRLPNAAIHNGFIDEAAEPPPPTPHAPPRIALLGRLVPWKGCDLFVEAAANLRSRGIAAEFRLIGEFDDPAYRARLMAKAEAAGVLWFPFDEDKRSLYGQLDIVVNASIEPEPFGRTLAEAAMFGLPAVGPDRAGPAEIIRHGITGVTFRSGDAGALAEALGSLAADPGLRAKLGNEARADFPRRFSIAAIAGRIAREVYDEIPGAKGRP